MWKNPVVAPTGRGNGNSGTSTRRERGFYRDHRITECLGLEGPSVGHPAQPPAQAGSPRAGGTAPRPGGAGISPEKETPQPLMAAWARAPSPSEGRSSSSGSAGASHASVCARCPLSCCWAPLKGVGSLILRGIPTNAVCFILTEPGTSVCPPRFLLLAAINSFLANEPPTPPGKSQDSKGKACGEPWQDMIYWHCLYQQRQSKLS